MKPYTLLIVSDELPQSWASVYGSMQMLTYGMSSAFGSLLHIRVIQATTAQDSYPEADFALCFVYNTPSAKTLHARLRQVPGMRRVTSLAECPIQDMHTFLLQGSLRYPVCRSLLAQTTTAFKAKGSVLIDHPWPDDERDLTAWLYGQLAYWPGYVFYLVRKATEQRPRFANFTPLEYRAYVEYLAATASVERFLVTHKESYGFSVIDMAARGIQVISPRGFLPPYMVADFQIPEFSTASELFAILHRPVGDDWKNKIRFCIDYPTIAWQLDQQFQAWID